MRRNKMTHEPSPFFGAGVHAGHISRLFKSHAAQFQCSLGTVTVQGHFLVFGSSVNQSNHLTAGIMTAATIFKPKNEARANIMHPIPNACKFRRSIPAFFMPGSNASSICVFFERSGMYLKSNVVSSPKPLLRMIMTCQRPLRNA